MTLESLRPYQVEDLANLIAHERWGLWHDPACGKTPPVCVWMWWLWDELKMKSGFVMPKSLLGKNRDEVLRFTHFKPEDVIIMEEPPVEVRVLKLLEATQQGLLELIRTPNAHMARVLASDISYEKERGGFLEWREKLNQPAAKKALKLGWIEQILPRPIGPMLDGRTLDMIDLFRLTPAGQLAKDSHQEKSGYAIKISRTKSEYVGRVLVDNLIEKGLLVLLGNPEDLRRKLALTPLAQIVMSAGTLEKPLKLDAKVILMGFDFYAENWEWLTRYNPDLRALPVDEIHMGFGGHKSARTEKFYQSMRVMKRFVPMTGTLINGRLDSAYPTIHVMEPRYYTSYEGFMMEHEITDYWGGHIAWDKHEKIAEILQKHGTRRTFADVYGKEAKLIIPEIADMSPKQKAAYDEFHNDALLELEDSFLDGTLPGVAVIRARQIMQHPELFGLADKETTGKDELLKVHLATDGPLLIFSVFQPEQDRIGGCPARC